MGTGTGEMGKPSDYWDRDAGNYGVKKWHDSASGSVFDDNVGRSRIESAGHYSTICDVCIQQIFDINITLAYRILKFFLLYKRGYLQQNLYELRFLQYFNDNR